jgi:NAD(P)-dependent dehydrogenase (short-subunit alcohol dehydrogenase family)
MTIKNVLITGCNRGIGFELCKQLCQLSTTEKVIATTRRPQNATVFQKLILIKVQKLKLNFFLFDYQELNRLLGFHYPKLHLLKLETTDYRYYDKLLDDCHKIVGNKGLNLLINNAGIISRDSLPIVTAQHVMDNFETNAVAPLMLTKKLLPLLITSAKNMEPTSVVNISSTLGSMKSNVVNGQQYYPYRISKVLEKLT